MFSNEFTDISAQFGDGSFAPNAVRQLLSADGNEMVLEILDDFLAKAAGIERLDEIHAAADYIAPFLAFPTSYELPKVTKYQSKELIESHYEDFLAYQTHNAQILDFYSTTH